MSSWTDAHWMYNEPRGWWARRKWRRHARSNRARMYKMFGISRWVRFKCWLRMRGRKTNEQLQIEYTMKAVDDWDKWFEETFG